tara:strand:- start:56 stop:466 length:411 start_codon:yes stop_codon:yes gene_type:complete
MKTVVLFTLTFICLIGTMNAQKIKFKKGKVIIDNVECLNYDGDSNNVELTTTDNKQTIFLKFIRTGIGQNGGLYTKVIFVEQDKSFTSKSYIFSKKLLIKKLLSDEVLVDCKIDESKIDKFLLKYDEGIEDTLIRH